MASGVKTRAQGPTAVARASRQLTIRDSTETVLDTLGSRGLAEGPYEP